MEEYSDGLTMDLDLEERDRDVFEPILHNLQRECLASFTSTVRHSGHSSTGTISPTTPQPIECDLLPKIKCGSYHAVMTLVFTDGVEWVFKVPAKGYGRRWKELNAQALESEAQTMHLICRKTTILIPEVYAFSASINSELGCPFILMEKFSGKDLYQGWFDDEMSEAKRKRQHFRARALQGIAKGMTQLNNLAFDRGSSLMFDSEGSVYDIGSRNLVDWTAFYANLCAREENVDDNDDVFLPLRATGPFNDVRSYFFDALDRREGTAEHTPFSKGAHNLLRRLIDWGHVNSSTTSQAFVLAHPDFDTQSFFTASDGTLTGIIDWEWAALVPRSVGYLKLPNLLMRDFGPEHYDYDVKAGKTDEVCDECSTTELACYRAMYAQSVEKCLGIKKAADMTRRSLVMGNLDLAANNPLISLNIVSHMFRQIEQLTAAAGELDKSNMESKPSDNGIEEEDDDPIDNMSFDECLAEIEKLSDFSFNDDTTDSRASSASTTRNVKGVLCSDANSEGSPITAKTDISRVWRLGQSACGWGSKRFRHAAQCLYQREAETALSKDLDNLKEGTVESRKFRATRAIFRWSLQKLNRVIKFMHCEAELGSGQGNEKEMRFSIKGGLETAIAWLREKLQNVFRVLFRQKANVESEVLEAEIPETEVLETMFVQPTDTAATGLQHRLDSATATKNRKKRIACGQVARMLEKDDFLNDVAQRAITRWVVRNLRSEDSAEEAPGEESEQQCPDVVAEAEVAEEHYWQQASRKYFRMSKSLAESKLMEDSKPVEQSGPFQESESVEESIPIEERDLDAKPDLVSVLDQQSHDKFSVLSETIQPKISEAEDVSPRLENLDLINKDQSAQGFKHKAGVSDIEVSEIAKKELVPSEVVEDLAECHFSVSPFGHSRDMASNEQGKPKNIDVEPIKQDSIIMEGGTFDKEEVQTTKQNAPQSDIIVSKNELVVAAIAAAGETGFSRNKPCPCGSRRKFKKCHAKAQNNSSISQTEYHSASPTKGSMQGTAPQASFSNFTFGNNDRLEQTGIHGSLAHPALDVDVEVDKTGELRIAQGPDSPSQCNFKDSPTAVSHFDAIFPNHNRFEEVRLYEPLKFPTLEARAKASEDLCVIRDPDSAFEVCAVE